jgi:glycine cleavage system H protein
MDPTTLKYTQDHEWIGQQGDLYIVGITAFAQDQLGDITYIELPEIGREVAAHEEVAVVESVKAASDIYAPAAGTVKECNPALEETPELVNTAPYAEGWLFKLADLNAADLDALMDATAYETYLAGLQE